MRRLRVAVIAGTSDATDLIDSLPFCEVTAFAATSYGEEILRHTGCTVRTGRLDEAGFTEALAGFDAVVDASHPFAVQVTETVSNVCLRLQIPYFRLGRHTECYHGDIRFVNTKEEAAALLSKMQGNILLTTGVNTLSFYERHITDFGNRVWARILDVTESRRLAAGSQAKLIYAVPPFTAADTLRLLKQHHIAVMLSKDSGRRGGLPEKLAAAEAAGIPTVLIRMPAQGNTMTAQEIYRALSDLDTKRGS